MSFSRILPQNNLISPALPVSASPPQTQPNPSATPNHNPTPTSTAPANSSTNRSPPVLVQSPSLIPAAAARALLTQPHALPRWGQQGKNRSLMQLQPMNCMSTFSQIRLYQLVQSLYHLHQHTQCIDNRKKLNQQQEPLVQQFKNELLQIQ